MARTRILPFLLLVCLLTTLFPENADAAYQPLRCTNGQPEPGTSLYDDSPNGACQFVGTRYIFSTIICQFVVMINTIMGKLYCSIQAAIQQIVLLTVVVFVMVYGIQMLMGTAQLNGSEVITRVIKMSLVLWLVTDSTFGVSAGIAYMFNFFISFISDSTRWVVQVLDQGSGLGIYNAFAYNAGVTATFYFIDNWIYDALTGSLSAANAKVIGFFVAMSAALPSVFFMAIYWLSSLVSMLIRTLITFLMAVIAIAFLLGLSPIFLSFMLFRVTFSYFDQWLRFMISYALQVMVSFAILTMWLFSLTLFTPFFNELADVIFPYEKVIRPATAIYNPADTWGLCPMKVTANPIPSLRCVNPGFNPIGPGVDPNFPGGNNDFKKVIPPSKVPELNHFLYFIFYHLISLIIVSYGFASLQKNSSNISRQLGGPSYVPILNSSGLSNTGVWRAHGGGAGVGSVVASSQQEANRFMSRELFTSFSRRHEAGATPYEQMVRGFGNLVSGR